MTSWSKIHQISTNWRKCIQRTIWIKLDLDRIGSIRRPAMCLRWKMMSPWKTKMQAGIEMTRGRCRFMRWRRGRGLYLGIRRPIRILILSIITFRPSEITGWWESVMAMGLSDTWSPTLWRSIYLRFCQIWYWIKKIKVTEAKSKSHFYRK